MRKIFAFSAMALLLALQPACRADDAVRSAQAILKSAGYYAGEATGELDADTKAALRRYQIRNQLQPTGELTPETAAALNKEGEPAASEPAAPEPAASVPPPPPSVAPTPYSQPAPPPPAPVRLSEPAPDYSKVFERTPYAVSSLEVQRDVVRRAQAQLAQRGFYDGPVNGALNPQTEEALLRLQASRQLPRTGILDIDTLAELHLLPVTRARIRVGERPPGAVRGIPVD